MTQVAGTSGMRAGAETARARAQDEAARFIAALCGEEAHPAMPATVVVGAHPDDEVVGAGSRLGRLREATIVHVTDGAPQDGRDAAAHGLAGPAEYAQVRRNELAAALQLCGIAPEQAICLQCPDQQATLRMGKIARQLAAVFEQKGARIVLTHPYEGGHPDHDATALAVHAAVHHMARAGLRVPAIVEMTSYHNGPTGICPCEFLPAEGCVVTTVVLNEGERALKRRLFDCFTTQLGTLQYFPIGIERFRPAPAYDFVVPPHEGKLFYECFDWGMSGERFRALAQQTLRELGLEGWL